MGVAGLDSTQALNPGAELWVLSSSSQTTWLPRLDWALNFQILKSNDHKKRTCSSRLQKILKETEVLGPSDENQIKSKPADHTSPDMPLLISAQNHLPCQWVLIFDYSSAKELNQVAQELNVKTLRIFCSLKKQAEEISKHWPDIATELELQIVLD